MYSGTLNFKTLKSFMSLKRGSHIMGRSWKGNDSGVFIVNLDYHVHSNGGCLGLCFGINSYCILQMTGSKELWYGK